MKILAMILLALSCNQVVCAEGDWINVIDKVTVHIESTLYEKKGDPHFFIHVKLRNQTHYEIGVDLSDEWNVLYPNQWGGSDLEYRFVINERVMAPKELNAEFKARLIQAFKSKELVLLQAGKSFDYYTNFNASGRSKVQAAKGKFILISIKGQLCFTDGSKVWDKQPSRDLVIKKPVTWKTIPKNAIVIER